MERVGLHGWVVVEAGRMAPAESGGGADERVGQRLAECRPLVQALCAALNVPPLSTYGVKAGDFALIIEKAEKSSSMKGNPIELTREEMEEILRRAL